MKTVTHGRKRAIKEERKDKEQADLPNFQSLEIADTPQEKPVISDLITCQICKDQIVDDHRMCPKCMQIWCYECIRPWLRLKNYSCPNCRKSIKAKQLKKSPLFQKLKEFIRHHHHSVEETTKGSICEVHKEPDNFFCDEYAPYLMRSTKDTTLALLKAFMMQERNPSKNKREELGEFKSDLLKLLEESNSNNERSQINFKASKELLTKRVKAWEEDFCKKFEVKYDTQIHSKYKIEKALDEIKTQDKNITALLEYPHQSKLVKDFDNILDNSKEIIFQKESIKVSRIIDGEEIENNFIPPYVTKECSITGVNNNSQCDNIIYADEFDLFKDKFKFGIKFFKNKKSKNVEISLRITKANTRAKFYESKLYIVDSDNQENFIGEFNIELEAHPLSTNIILHTMTMNTNFEKMKIDNDKFIFLLKIRPISYQQIATDLQDYIDSLEQSD